MRDLIFTLLMLGCFVRGFGRPWLSLLVWVWLDYMAPHRLCYSYAKYDIPFSMIFATQTVLGLIFSRETKKFPLSRETVLLIIFCLWMTITTFFAINQYLAWAEWNRVMKIQLLILTTLVMVNSRERVETLLWLIVVSLGFYGIKGGLFTFLAGGEHRVYGPEFTFIQDNNDLAMALVTTLPLMRYLQMNATQRWVRWGLGAAILLCSLSVLGSYSRGGLIGLAITLVAMTLKARKRLLLTACLAIFLPFVWKMMPQEYHDRMSSISDYDEDNSAKGRLNAWRFAINVAKDRPIVGGGFVVFTASQFKKYAPDPDDYHAAHNIFFKILGEHGVPGIFLFLLLAVLTWRSGTWVRRHAKGIPELAWTRDLVSMAQVALLAYGVGGFFLNLAYFDLPYHLMTVIVTCKMIVKRYAAGHETADTIEPSLETEPELAPQF